MREPYSKIKSLAKLLPIITKLKADGKKIVLAHGVFDLVHYGHMYHLGQAKRMGDILVVSMKTDPFIGKGAGRPLFPTKIRATSLGFLECVDYVLLCEENGPYRIIGKLKPDIYVKGNEYLDQLRDPKSGINKDKRLVEAAGGSIRFTKIIKITKRVPLHSTKLIRSNLDILARSYRRGT